MVARVALGWEIIGTCEALTWLTTEPARAAMNRWVAGGMAWSLVATRYHDGIVFHAGTPEGSVNAATENGRWVAYIRLVVLRGRSPANASRKTSALMYRSTPLPPPGSG